MIQSIITSMTAKKCKQCEAEFVISKDDENFLEKIKVPTPLLCPNCREQRRLAQGNQLHLYKRKCDLTNKEIISNYHPESPHKVFDQNVWYSDKWDPLEYGMAYDFSRSFFEQFKELSLKVPRPSLHRGFQYDENSDYTNYAGKNKNCYMIFDSDENRDCYYSYSLNSSESCMDCYRVRASELCYECVDCEKCYASAHLQDCVNCSNSYFLQNCIGCKNCIMCSNLRNKEFYVNNEKVSEEEFAKQKAKCHSWNDLNQGMKYFNSFKLKFPKKNIHGVQNENVVGDYLSNCKNAYYCFDSAGLWDCSYVFQAFNPLKNCMDIQECGDGELLYESTFCGYDAYNLKFCSHCLGTCSDLQYCYHCPHSSNLFGCIGMQRKKYCILNKQYSEEEYKELVEKIIEQMRQDGEYGEFFPIELSSFAYNETIAQLHYPLEKGAAQKMGYKWRDENKEEYLKATYNPPDTIAEVSEGVLGELLKCVKSGRNYKIIKAEFDLLKKLDMPLPRECFFERNDRRSKMRNQWRIFDRLCAKNSEPIKTSYSPKDPEIVFCEECYLKEIN